jgi:hypothetical protein
VIVRLRTASGRSSSLLNIDWMARCGRGWSSLPVKPAPATGYINPVFASRAALEDREAAFWEAKRQEEARRRKEIRDVMLQKQVILSMRQHSNRVYNVNLQTIRLVFQPFKADHELARFRRTPQGRYRNGERKRQRAKRMDQRIVTFAPTLSTEVRVLTPMPFSSESTSPYVDVYRPSDTGPFFVTEHAYACEQHVIWNLPMQTHLNDKELMDLSYTHKRVAVDEVDSKLNYDEHLIAQRYGGDDSLKWRKALQEAEGVEETALRAVWGGRGGAEHPKFATAMVGCRSSRQSLLVQQMLERDVMQSRSYFLLFGTEELAWPSAAAGWVAS